MKEELLEAIYGTVERLEQKVDELSASPKNAESGNTPFLQVLTQANLKKPILAMSVKEEEAIGKIWQIKRGHLSFLPTLPRKNKQR